jgi:hypothetical protein
MGPVLGTWHRGRVWEAHGGSAVLQAFLTYLEEHPATQALAGVFTEVLIEQGDLAPLEEAVA